MLVPKRKDTDLRNEKRKEGYQVAWRSAAISKSTVDGCAQTPRMQPEYLRTEVHDASVQSVSRTSTGLFVDPSYTRRCLMYVDFRERQSI